MSPFEYATGLVSIVIGLAFARVLGGIGVFITARDRTPSDWFVASWCVVILVNLGGWWVAVWNTMQRQTEIEFATLLAVILATSLLYLASSVLVFSARIDGGPGETPSDPIPRAAFFYCLGAHFAVVVAMGFTFRINAPVVDLLETAALAAAAVAGAAAKRPRVRGLHLIIWMLLLFWMLADNTPRIALTD
jgi:hypothetical protein